MQHHADAAVKHATTVSVPARLSRPHAVIAKWIAEHEQERQEAKRNRYAQLADWSGTDRRRLRVLETLFKAAELLELEVKTDRDNTWFAYGAERIDFKMREKLRQIRRPMKPEELKWRSDDGSDWVRELVPSGLLTFSIETYLGSIGVCREWKETEKAPIETLIPDILKSLAVAGPALVELRKERAEQERIRHEASTQRPANPIFWLSCHTWWRARQIPPESGTFSSPPSLPARRKSKWRLRKLPR
jgi:hypothetical protein